MDLWDEIAREAAEESPLWGEALLPESERELVAVFSPLLDQSKYAIGLETIYEGYLLHYGRPRLFAAGDDRNALLLGDYLFMVNDGGLASCVEAKTGKVLWGPERLDGEFSASPVAAGGNVYFCNQSGKTFVVAAKPEFNLVAENRLDASGVPSPGGFMASPAIAGDNLFLRTRTHLYCIGKK